MKDTKVIAFYLPQFHAIPENDKAYGEGFTEWINVKKAKPLYEGHNQPRIPLDKNYYNLLDKDVLKKQAEQAKQYGIYGFCYYHYWFANGKKLLEKPLENMLRDKQIDMPFCLCWANENWTKRWDGGNNEIIVEQDYGDYQDLKNHVHYLLQYFEDERYIKIDDKPILLIYKPELIKNCKKYIKTLRKEFLKNNMEIMIGFQFPDAIVFGNYDKYCDFYVEFEPSYVQKILMKEERNVLQNFIHDVYASSQFEKIRHFMKRKRKAGTLQKLDYDAAWKKILDHKILSDKAMAGTFVDWDNTARKKNGIVYTNTSVEKFGYYFDKYVNSLSDKYKYDYIFINAWNEWGEGAYLEPDVKNGFGFLEMIKKTLEKR